ncbi:hypothetical protein BH24ACT23_BH24ACT23_10370 [soil metagenome]
MRARIPKITRRRLAVLLVLGALGFGGWYAFLRDDSSSDPGSVPADGKTGAGREDSRGPAGGLSVAEQAEQVLLLGFEGTDSVSPFVQSLGQRQVGAVLIRTENWTGASTGTTLVDAIRKAGSGGDRVPPLIATAQEGGIYRSLGDLPPAERALDIGRDGSRDEARSWAADAAGALAEAGIKLDLFPIADVATLDSPLAGRAFSDDPATVAGLTAAALDGCKDAGIACAPAHFPGLGAASGDPASGPATISLDSQALAERDLVPFAAAARAAPAMVISLGLYAAYDAVVPAALTPQVSTSLLRGQLRFKGVAISGDLSSGAIEGIYQTDDAAVEALKAGIDLVQVSEPADQEGVAVAIERAVKAGELPPERLEEAVGRVLRLKRDLGIAR